MKTIHRNTLVALMLGVSLCAMSGLATDCPAADDDVPAKAVATDATIQPEAAPAETPQNEAGTGDMGQGSGVREAETAETPQNEAEEPAPVSTGEAQAQQGGDEPQESGGIPWTILGIVAALFIVPIIIGNYLSGALRMPDHGWKISVAIGTITAASIILVFGELKQGVDLAGGVTLIYELEEPEVDETTTEDERRRSQKDLMDKMVNAITRRINPGGQLEVTVRKYGEDQIEIIIPKAGQEDLDQIKHNVTSLGELEFRITADADQDDDKEIIEKALALTPYQSKLIEEQDGKQKIIAKWVSYDEGELETGGKIITRTGKNRLDEDVNEVLMLVDPYNVIGKYLKKSYASSDETGNPAVRFEFNSEGARRFGKLTTDNLPNRGGQKRYLGVILNRKLESAPSIGERITDSGIIHGNFTAQEVEDLVGVLNAGSLPAELNTVPISEEVISPTIGAATIQKGKFAISVSVVAVLVFMAIYYHFSGIVACLALTANLVLILGVMVLIRAHLTLPGLAGLVLTIGMSVDANVLIFERIREELSRGAAMRMAIRNGFGRATRTIVDANLTTLITGIVLFWIGTDQIKGFAVTLILGILMSMYTAIFCSRIVFDIAERQRWISKLKMYQLIGNTHINFLSKTSIAAVFSFLLITVGLIAVFMRGTELLNIDFTGGVSVTMVLNDDDKMSQADVDKLLRETDLGDRNLLVVEQGTDRTQFNINARYEEMPKGETSDPKSLGAVEEVEKIIHDVFGNKLKTYHVKVEAIEQITSPAEQSSNRMPTDDTVTIDYDPTGTTLTPVAFLQEGDADTLDVPAEIEANSDETPADSKAGTNEDADEEDAVELVESPDIAVPAGANEDSPTPQDTQDAGKKNVYDGGTKTTLIFGEPVASATVIRRLEELFSDNVNFKLASPGLISGSAARVKEWRLQVDIPPEQAKHLLDKFAQDTNEQPLFPLSNRIGSRVAGQMQQLAGMAVLISLLCIIGYIWLRFQRVVYGLAAVVALVHDVLVTLGMIAISAYIVQFIGPVAGVLRIEPFQISLPILAAFLTIIGYSLNDTIVVFDRIREVRGKSPDLSGDMINTSINQMLNRTLLTSLTTFIVVVILYFAGGAGIHGFAFALVVGVVVGTYSSIFVASPALLWMSTPRKKANTA